MSYVTGSHSVKAGVQWQWGTFYHRDESNGDIVQRFQTAIKDEHGAVIGFANPLDVLAQNTPVQSRERLNRDLGFFVQDTWTIKRLTVTGGIRRESINSQVDSLTAAAGRFVPERTHTEITDLPDWGDWAPRFQAAFDLFGNSKTAIKYRRTDTTRRRRPALPRRSTRSAARTRPTSFPGSTRTATRSPRAAGAGTLTAPSSPTATSGTTTAASST